MKEICLQSNMCGFERFINWLNLFDNNNNNNSNAKYII